MSYADTIKKIGVVEASGKQFQNAVQAASLSIVGHMAQNRDKTLLPKLWDAMPNGTRRKAVIDWINHYVSGFEVSYKGGHLTIDLADVNSPDWKQFVDGLDDTLSAMHDTPWHAWAKPEKGQQDAVTLKAVLEYIKRKANSKDADEEEKARIAKVAEFAEGLMTA
jgi:hypothetical protein